MTANTVGPLSADGLLRHPGVIGPPGIYLQPDLRREARASARLDTCAFVGITARGPAWELRADEADEPEPLMSGRTPSVAVRVRSWAEFEEIFGGDEGPGLLPRSVAAFFNSGGRTAYVVRIVPWRLDQLPGTQLPTVHGVAGSGPRPSVPACALFRVDLANASLLLRARNEGSWGNRLDITVRLHTRPLPLLLLDDGRLQTAAGIDLPIGTLIRIGGPTSGPPRLHQVIDRTVDWTNDGWRGAARLDPPTFPVASTSIAGPNAAAADPVVEVVTAEVTVSLDGRRVERFDGLSFCGAHPDWIGRRLSSGSRLIEVDPAGSDPAGLSWLPEPTLVAPTIIRVADGYDRYAEITFEDVLGPESLSWMDDLPQSLAEDIPPAGLGAVVNLPDCATVCVPDLYSPADADASLAARDVADRPVLGGSEFELCLGPVMLEEPAPAPGYDLPLLRLDPRDRRDLDLIVQLQNRLVRKATRLDLVTLLDVPPLLQLAEVWRWRGGFDTSWAAGYLGWPCVAHPNGTRLRAVPPSAYAAGVLSTTERERGLFAGPAQVALAGALKVLDGPGRGAADRQLLGYLHSAGINVTIRERGGVRHTAARTLSRDPAVRQLTTRRLLIHLRRRLLTDLAWATFEPNAARLRVQVRLAIETVLDELYRGGAFAGEDRDSSYFVRIVDPTQGVGESQLIAEIGVAPSEPLEFLLVALLRTDDGTLAAVPAERADTGGRP